jgi:signal transduction histidine kinase
MQPEPLESARLPEALADVASKWTRIHGVPATVTTTGQPRRIRPDAEITLLRAAQEALVNVARHARAGKVGLTLSYMEDQVNLDIRDDGVGFDPQPAGAIVPARAGGSGYGLLAMRQRVEGVAGTLEVESAPGGGTAISASVPTGGGW